MSPYALLGAGVLWVASVAAAGWLAYGAGQNAEIAIQAREDRASAVGREAAASAIAAAIPKITVKHQTVRQELEREIQTREVYRDPGCRTGADSLQLFNSTIPGAAAAALDPGAVPTQNAGN